MTLSLYEQLKFFRKTQEEFARDVGVSLATVSRWVNNKSKPLPLYQQKITEVINGYKKEIQNQELLKKAFGEWP